MNLVMLTFLALSASVSPDAPRLDVSIDANSAKTGRLMVVAVAVAAAVAPIKSLNISLAGKRGVACETSADHRRFRALVPVNIEQKPGQLSLAIEAALDDGGFIRWQKPVAVTAGSYDKRTITVGKKFTSPSKAQRQRAAAEAKTLSAAMADTVPDRLWRGSFVKPTAGGMTSPFGTLRTYNKKRRSRHLGLDLDGDVGDAIVAANAGRVVMAMERFYTGGTVVIDHGQGLLTMYFHMSRIDVVSGQRVHSGQHLGAVGASGQVTGPHLHFSVKLDGLYADPSHLLQLDFSDDALAAASTTAPSDAPVDPDEAKPAQGDAEEASAVAR
jgi:murein DD-endopeptidase MepM/ murein hydrolase activator NlpD